MVDALKKAGRALRPGGYVVEIEPDDSRLPRLELHTGGRPAILGLIERDADEDVMAAQRALDRSLTRGLFVPVAVVDHEYFERFASVEALEAEWSRHTSWRPNRSLRQRLRQAWPAAGAASRPAIAWSLRLTVLRKPSRRGIARTRSTSRVGPLEVTGRG